MIVWDMDPEAIRIGDFAVRWYGLLFATSFLMGFHLTKQIFVAEKVKVELLDRLLIFMIVGTVLGARLGHTLFYEPEVYLQNPLRILKVWEGGLASHGAFVGITVALWIFCRRHGLGLLWLMDRLTLGVALAGFFIRLGNFFNSEIVGRPSDLPWAVSFARLDGVARHPAQLYESISYLLIFLVLYWFYWKTAVSKARGFMLGAFLVLVFGVRFVLEFFKENQVPFEAGLPVNMGQLLSVPLVLGGLFLMWQAYRYTAQSGARGK